MKWVYNDGEDGLGSRWRFFDDDGAWFAVAHEASCKTLFRKTDDLNRHIFGTIDKAKAFIEYVYAYNKVTGEWPTREQFDQHLLT